MLEEFLEAVDASPLSPEDISRRVGGKPSGPTIRRYQRGDWPEKRIEPETKAGMLAFMTSQDDESLGEEEATEGLSFNERLLRVLEQESRQATNRSIAARELATAARLEAESARDRHRVFSPNAREVEAAAIGQESDEEILRRRGLRSDAPPAPSKPDRPASEKESDAAE